MISELWLISILTDITCRVLQVSLDGPLPVGLVTIECRVGGIVSNSVSMLVLSCAAACAEMLKLLPRLLPGAGLADSMLLSPSPEFEPQLLEMGVFFARMADDAASNTKVCLVPGHSEAQHLPVSNHQSTAELETRGSHLLEYFCERPMPATVSLLLQCLTKAGCSWQQFAGGWHL
jgi:hypothetical protein